MSLIKNLQVQFFCVFSSIENVGSKQVFFFGLIIWFHRFLFFELTSDDILRILASVNIYNFNDYVVRHFDLESCSFVVKSMHHLWPILTSYILSFLNILTQNGAISFIILEFIFCIFFALIVWRFLNQVICFKYAKTAYFFIMVNPTLSITYISTDLSAFVIFYSAVLYILQKKTGQDKVSFTVFSTILFALPSLLRFGYYPLAFIPFFYFLLNWLVKKQDLKPLNLTFSILIPIVIIGLQTYFIKLNTSKIAYIEPEYFQIYWENLLNVRPYFINSFLNVNIHNLIIWLQNSSWSNHQTEIMILIRLFAVFLEFSLLVFILFKIVRKSLDSKNLLFIIIILTNVFSLILLSLLVKSEILVFNNLPYRWSYTSENRYFAPAAFSLFLLILYNIQYLPKKLILIVGVFVILVGGIKHLNRFRLMDFNSIENFEAFKVHSTYSDINSNDFLITDKKAIYSYHHNQIKSVYYDCRTSVKKAKFMSSEINQCFPNSNIIIEVQKNNLVNLQLARKFKEYLNQDSIEIREYD